LLEELHGVISSQITADHVLAAIAEIDRVGVPPGRESTWYHLVYQGRHYPPKYVVSLAAKYALGQELHPSIFSGGAETNSFLRELGYDVEGSAAGVHPRLGLERSVSRKRGAPHTEHCQVCKKTVLALTRALHGAVEVQKRFEIGATSEAFSASAYLPQLRDIFAALGRERGFTAFVRSPAIPPCDYVVPQPGFILEFDESRHFTPLRRLALSGYPLPPGAAGAKHLSFSRSPKPLRAARE
jgi:hypothetical protein